MNSTGCPRGYATDQLMLYGEDLKLGSCEVYFPLFLGLFLSLTVFRFALSVVLLKQWLDREKARRALKKEVDKKYHRLPVVPGFLFFAVIFLALFTALSSVNLINSSNNGSLVLLCLFYIPAMMFGYVSTKRVLKFGKRIIPLSKRTSLEVRDQIFFKIDSLDRTDYVLQALFMFTYLVFLLNPISMIVFGSIFRGNYIPAQLGFFSYAVMDIIIGLGLSNQNRFRIKMKLQTF